ncbi:MAG TPA: YdcF family protein [Candidatus Doudnabacteria bacterium]|nr:YdcF family protein [Candidatus Doudnabacteria bacterium]
MNIFVKILKYFLLAVLVVLVVNVSFIYAIAKSRPEIERADAIIVLGAAINTPALTNRTAEGLRLYQNGKAEVMVLSGGKISESDISEAQYMEKIIKRFSDETVEYLLEENSGTTYENIKNSQAKLREAGRVDDGSVVIVSDEFHLARGVLLAKRAGFETVYWSAPAPDYYSQEQLRFYYFREFMAMINYIPKFIFG